MRDPIVEALKLSNVDYAEVRVERSRGSGFAYRGKQLDSVSTHGGTGGIVRALWRGGWGLATFNDLEAIADSVRAACECARLVGKEASQLAEVEPVEDACRAMLGRDFRGMSIKDKMAVVSEYNDLILGHSDAIETTSVSYSDEFCEIWYANTEGTYLEMDLPDLSLHMTATARRGDDVQRAFESVGGAQGFQIAEGLHARAEEAAQRAVELLDAKPAVGGQYLAVTNPKLSGVFAHEAFGHLSEADHVYEDEKMKELMVLDRRFGPDGLNIIDDGSIPGERGSAKYDDEGVATRQNYLIKDGVLVGRLHNRETAGKMGEPVTGNARAVGCHSPPLVRMTNTYIDAGDTSFHDMIADVDLGVYACDMFGGQTAMEMFTFSAAYGYMIRRGQVAEMVRDVVLTGNVFETLENVDRIGDAVVWSRSGGGCGKGGQGGLPVGIGGPHLLIRDVTIGGRQ